MAGFGPVGLDFPPPIPEDVYVSYLFFRPTDLDDPVVTVHQSIGEAKEQFYYERTVFLRCVANSNPPVRYSWHRGREVLTQGSDKGVEIYEPFFTQVNSNTTLTPYCASRGAHLRSHDYMSSSPPFYFGRNPVQFVISPPDGGKPITILKIQLIAPIKVFISKFID